MRLLPDGAVLIENQNSPPNVFWLLKLDIKHGESVPMPLWFWWHYHFITVN